MSLTLARSSLCALRRIGVSLLLHVRRAAGRRSEEANRDGSLELERDGEASRSASLSRFERVSRLPELPGCAPQPACVLRKPRPRQPHGAKSRARHGEAIAVLQPRCFREELTSLLPMEG